MIVLEYGHLSDAVGHDWVHCPIFRDHFRANGKITLRHQGRVFVSRLGVARDETIRPGVVGFGLVRRLRMRERIEHQVSILERGIG